MEPGGQRTSRHWFILTLALSCVTLLALVFALWELVEHRYFRGLDYSTLHYLYITRGIATSLLLALWASWFVLRQRRHHENELEQSYEQYRSILNSTPEAVVLFDRNFRVVEWNEAAEKLYGLGREQVLGQVLPTIPAERWSELKEVVTRVEEGQGVLDHETDRLTAGEERIPVAVSYSRMPPLRKESRFFLEVAQDIRPRLRLREKLLEVEKLTLMGQMAAGTAHHLNTPLTAMLLQVEMLRQQVQDREPRVELASMEQRIRFCQMFVQHLLQFARRPQLQQKPTSLCEVIEAVVTLFRPSLSLKRANLRIDLDGLRHGRLLGDPNHLEALFSALVSNAVDALPAGGSLEIHGSVRDNRQVEVYIDDSGTGIPEGLWSHLFEPFYTTKPAGQGTGLGLVIARNIAEVHGGSLHLENRKPAGVRAIVRLPLLEPAGTSSAARKEKIA